MLDLMCELVISCGFVVSLVVQSTLSKSHCPFQEHNLQGAHAAMDLWHTQHTECTITSSGMDKLQCVTLSAFVGLM